MTDHTCEWLFRALAFMFLALIVLTLPALDKLGEQSSCSTLSCGQ